MQSTYAVKPAIWGPAKVPVYEASLGLQRTLGVVSKAEWLHK